MRNLRIHLCDLATGETLAAAKERAHLLAQALLSLNDSELVVINARSAGLTFRLSGIHAGYSHPTCMRVEKRAIIKLRAWFEARGILKLGDIL